MYNKIPCKKHGIKKKIWNSLHNGEIGTDEIEPSTTLDISQLLFLLSYVPRTPPGADFLAVLRKPPAFMPLASIVLYNDISDINDIFYLISHFFKYVSLM